ncbi:MAG TPA: tripartite tricarboxylate transporter substrate binding protein [Burkholderiales bacterium]|nr:tripartite tricarboxylate transporter substrate binding protein [Burkholderiales bacterium]
MKTGSRVFVVSLALLTFAAGDAAGQAYPTKPIRMVVPFAPGGGTDIMARVIMPQVEQRLNQRIIIDNRVGGGGYIAAELVTKSPPDGHTLFFTAANIVMSLELYPNQPVDPLKDFAPVTLLTREPSLLAVHPSLPVKSVKELIALARSRPGELNYSSGGVGSSSHLNTELFKMMAKVNLLHVPYSGGTGPAVVGAITGESPVTILPISASLPQARAGRLRVLGITLPERAPDFPEFTPIAETLPGYSAFQWYGVLAPAATPKRILDQLDKALAAAMQVPDLRTRLVRDGAIVVSGSTPEQFAAHMRDEKAKWAKVVQVSGAGKK